MISSTFENVSKKNVQSFRGVSMNKKSKSLAPSKKIEDRGHKRCLT